MMADFQNVTPTQPPSISIFSDTSSVDFGNLFNHVEVGISGSTYTQKILYYGFDIGSNYQFGVAPNTIIQRFITTTRRISDLIYVNRSGRDCIGALLYHYGDFSSRIPENVPHILLSQNNGIPLFNMGTITTTAYTTVNLFDISLTPLWSSVIDSVEDNGNPTIPAGSNVTFVGVTPIPPRALSWDNSAQRIFAVIPISQRESGIRIYDHYTISAGLVAAQMSTGIYGGGIVSFNSLGKYIGQIPYAFNGGTLPCIARYNPYTQSIFADV